ncbi:uncharacterized protein LOC132936185 [Metopolophium dirhodum]|uniref:uncharacterized protein LOC132936185 n=1 Tax=Metopolophium dirhodum TaxID=44670 RepID=UPI00298F51A9|nr:uncharacterized protein LOC132936185 [Metopolophium dirhodum]
MTANGLALAPHKSECVVLTKKHSFRSPQIFVQGFQVPVKGNIRYLGVQLDTRLSFVAHASTVAAGAKRSAVALGRLMTNVGGPSQCKRQLLMSVMHSRLLYGAQVWADSVVGVKKSEGLLQQAQRVAALRIARCYRTVSDMSSLVLARLPPAPLLALERRRASELRKTGVRFTSAELRSVTIQLWQAEWEKTSKASWTKALIPDLNRWWHQGPRSVTFNMSQALTGHGCFQKYLCDRGKAISPDCPHCFSLMDNAQHTIFDCPHWENAREELRRSLGRPPGPEDVQELLCGPKIEDLPDDHAVRTRIMSSAARMKEEFWRMVENIMEAKQAMERDRQSQPRQDLLHHN